MFSSYNSKVYVNSELVSINWPFSSLWVMFAYFFVCLVICVWMLDIVKFTVLDTVYFCILVNILKLYSEILSYLDTVWSFWVLLLWLIRWAYSCVLLELIISCYRGKILLSFLPIALRLMSFSHIACEKILFLALCEHKVLFSNSFRFFPLASGSLQIMHGQINIQLNVHKSPWGLLGSIQGLYYLAEWLWGLNIYRYSLSYCHINILWTWFRSPDAKYP